MLDLDEAERRAHDLIEFTNGLEEAGQAQTARRSRMAARDVLELADMLRAERSARIAVQTSYKRCLAVLGQRADQALVRAVSEAAGE